MTIMPWTEKAPTGSQEQKEPKRMAMDTTARHSDAPDETCFCTTDVRDLLLTYLDAFTASRMIYSVYLQLLLLLV